MSETVEVEGDVGVKVREETAGVEKKETKSERQSVE